MRSSTNGSSQGWQSENDYLERKKMIANIVLRLQQRKPNAPQEWLNKLPQMAKRLEESLYRSAQSFEEYSDPNSLKQRLQRVAMNIGMKSTQIQKSQEPNIRQPGSQQPLPASAPQQVQYGGAPQAVVPPMPATQPPAAVGLNMTGPSDAAANGNQQPPQQVVRHQQQRLLLLRHAAKCRHEGGQCTVTPHCASMKKLWKHVAECKNQKCFVAHCVSSRCILSHYHGCKDAACPVCEPVRAAIHQTQEKQRHRHEAQQTQLPMASPVTARGIQPGGTHSTTSAPHVAAGKSAPAPTRSAIPPPEQQQPQPWQALQTVSIPDLSSKRCRTSGASSPTLLAMPSPRSQHPSATAGTWPSPSTMQPRSSPATMSVTAASTHQPQSPPPQSIVPQTVPNPWQSSTPLFSPVAPKAAAQPISSSRNNVAGADQVASVRGIAFENGKVLMPKHSGAKRPEESTRIHNLSVGRYETPNSSLNQGPMVPHVELKSKCLEVLRVLQQHHHAWVFNSPVDPVELGIPDYFQVIKEPMDLGTIRKKLENGAYHTLDEFEGNVHLTFDNAMLYNGEGSVVYTMANEMKQEFATLMKAQF